MKKKFMIHRHRNDQSHGSDMDPRFPLLPESAVFGVLVELHVKVYVHRSTMQIENDHSE